MTHQCSFCLKRFDFASKLQRHHLIHTGQKPFTCLMCGKAFRQSAHLKKHLESHVKLSPVPGSSQEDFTQLQYTTLQGDHTVSDVPTQTSSDQDGDTELVAQNWSSPEVWNNHEWSPLEKDFTEKQKLPENRLNDSAIQQRQIGGNAHQGKVHQCTLCLKLFSSPYQLQRHHLIHTGQKPFKCSTCGKTFRQMSHLKLHCRIHAGGDPLKETAQLLSGEEEIKCPSFGKNSDGQTDDGSHLNPVRLDCMSLSASTTPPHSPEHRKLGDSVLSSHKGHSLSVTPPTMFWEQTYAVDIEVTQHTCESKPGVVDASVKFDAQENFIHENDQKIEYKEVMNFNESLADLPKIAAHTMQLESNLAVKPEQWHPDYDNQNVPPERTVSSELQVSQTAFGDKEKTPQKGPYQCATCTKCFSAPSKLKRHILIHTGQRPFGCHICAKAFRQLAHLKFHLSTHFSQRLNKQSKSKVRCETGKFQFGDVSQKKVFNLNKHVECSSENLKPEEPFETNSGVIAAAKTAQSISFSSGLDNSALHSRGSEDERLGRERTGVKQPDEEEPPMTHHSEEESGEQIMDEEAYSREATKERHTSTHLTRIVHECPVCFKCFTAPSKLKRHCLIHTGQRPFQCHICWRAFRQLVHLKAHYRIHVVSVKRRTSPLQRHRFNTPFQFQRHQASNSGLKNFACNLCGWRFRSLTHLTVHQQSHNGPTDTTNLCKLDCTQQVSDHQKPEGSELSGKALTSVKVVTIDNISSASDSSAVKDLVANPVNNNRQSYWCTVCSKRFDAPSRLRRHVLIHTGQRPFKCILCSKAFRQRAHLKAHQCTHKFWRATSHSTLSEVKQVENTARQISLCKDDFKSSHPSSREASVVTDQADLYNSTTADNMDDHSHSVNFIPTLIRASGEQVDLVHPPDVATSDNRHNRSVPDCADRIHKNTGSNTAKVREYQCMICMKKFEFPSKLSRHLLIHMNIKPFTCDVCSKSFRQLCHLQSHLKIHKAKRDCDTLKVRGSHQQESFPSKDWSISEGPVPQEENMDHNQGPDHMLLPQKLSPDPPILVTNQDQTVQPRVSKFNHSLSHNDHAKHIKFHNPEVNEFGGELLFVSHCGTAEGELKRQDSTEAILASLPVRQCHSMHKNVSHADSPTLAHQTSKCTVRVKCAAPLIPKQIDISSSYDSTTPDNQNNHTINMPHPTSLTSSNKLQHVKAGANQCTVCLKNFDFPSKLSRHLLIHMGIKPYKCQICPKSFRQLCHLQSHLRVHSGTTRNVATILNQQDTATAGDGSLAEGHIFVPAPQDEHCLDQSLATANQEHFDIIPCHSFNGNEHEQNGHCGNQEPILSWADPGNINLSSDMQKEHCARAGTIKSESNCHEDQEWTYLPPKLETDTSVHAEEEKIICGRTYEQLNQPKLSQSCGSVQQQTEDKHNAKEIQQTYQIEGHYVSPSEEDLGKAKTDCEHYRPGWEQYSQLEISPGSQSESGVCETKEEAVEVQLGAERLVEVQLGTEEPDEARFYQPPNDLLICPGCGQCFSTERKLHLHKCVALRRSEERPKGSYQCAICFKSFDAPSKLKRHYVIHTGQRPFQCTVCAKAFTQSGHLKTHLLTHR